jgi:glycine/sarcosine N-methyltransferase
MDPYADFAVRYDRFFPAGGERDRAVEAFFRRLAAERGVSTLLDCACGTGRDLALLHGLGLEVAGSGLSGAMLEVARARLGPLGVPLLRADFRRLPDAFGEARFDAVTCLGTSLDHAESEEDLLAALRSIRAVLRDGGVLVLSQGTTDQMVREQPRFVPVVQERDFTRLFVIDWEDRGATYHVLDLVHDESERRFDTWSFHYPRLWLRGDQARALEEAGFHQLVFLGSWDGEPYDEAASGHLITLATR